VEDLEGEAVEGRMSLILVGLGLGLGLGGIVGGRANWRTDRRGCVGWVGEDEQGRWVGMRWCDGVVASVVFMWKDVFELKQSSPGWWFIWLGIQPIYLQLQLRRSLELDALEAELSHPSYLIAEHRHGA
jgi:hypothetical protein